MIFLQIQFKHRAALNIFIINGCTVNTQIVNFLCVFRFKIKKNYDFLIIHFQHRAALNIFIINGMYYGTAVVTLTTLTTAN